MDVLGCSHEPNVVSTDQGPDEGPVQPRTCRYERSTVPGSTRPCTPNQVQHSTFPYPVHVLSMLTALAARDLPPAIVKGLGGCHFFPGKGLHWVDSPQFNVVLLLTWFDGEKPCTQPADPRAPLLVTRARSFSSSTDHPTRGQSEKGPGRHLKFLVGGFRFVSCAQKA